MAKKKKNISFLRKFLAAFSLIVLTICIITCYVYYNRIYSPNVRLGQGETYLYIPTGSSYNDLIGIIARDGLVNNISSFEWLAEIKNLPNNIKPGRYKIPAGMNNNDLINLLRSGEQEPVRLTLGSYRTTVDIASKAGSVLECDSASLAELLLSGETAEQFGFTKTNFMVMFLPNTYEFFWNTSAEEFVSRMADEYKKFWTDEKKERAHNTGLTQSEVSVLASIVQQETLKADEMPVVAGVYINRLKKGMKLQADPTVVYAWGDFNLRRVLKKHLEINSPYNTYLYEGLPPGPICMPLQQTINAVLNFARHKYLFFCAKEDFSGYHNFAATGAEHERNAAKYRKALDKLKIK